MHHLRTDPEVEVTSELLQQFAAEHGGPIEIDGPNGTAHWNHPMLPIRYFAHIPAVMEHVPGVTFEVNER